MVVSKFDAYLIKVGNFNLKFVLFSNITKCLSFDIRSDWKEKLEKDKRIWEENKSSNGIEHTKQCLYIYIYIF